MAEWHEDSMPAQGWDLGLLARLLGLARPWRSRFAASAALLAGVTALEQAGPLIVGRLVDGPLAHGDAAGVAPWAALYLAAGLGVLALQAAETVLTARTGARITLDLRLELFRHIHRQGAAFFEANPVGRLMTRVIYDLETLGEFFTQGVVAVFNDMATLLFVAAALLWLDWRLGLAAMAFLPLLGLAVALYRRRARETQRAARAQTSRINGFLAERLAGMDTLQAYGAEAAAARDLAGLSGGLRDLMLRQLRLNALFLPAAELLAACAAALVLMWGGWLNRQGGLSLGVVVAALMYVARFYQPLRDLSDKLSLFQTTFACAERLFGLLDRAPEIADPPEPRPLPAWRGGAAFEGVWFAYQEPRWALKELSFSLAEGERLAVVGPTGAGKTSLALLLLRFYDPQRGRVLAGGVDLRELSRHELRRQAHLVLQEPFLFSGPLLESLRFADPGIPEARVRQACERVGADAFIRALPQAYATPLAEAGRDLSTGQRQLLALARALVFEPRLLILDEATAGVDPQSEDLIRRALREHLLTGRSSLTIAHRLSTVSGADRILVLKDGCLAEQGTHASLTAQGGLYARLAALQFGAQG